MTNENVHQQKPLYNMTNKNTQQQRTLNNTPNDRNLHQKSLYNATNGSTPQQRSLYSMTNESIKQKETPPMNTFEMDINKDYNKSSGINGLKTTSNGHNDHTVLKKDQQPTVKQSNHLHCQKNYCSHDEVVITKFLKGTGFKQEPPDVQEVNENGNPIDDAFTITNVHSQYQQKPENHTTLNGNQVTLSIDEDIVSLDENQVTNTFNDNKIELDLPIAHYSLDESEKENFDISVAGSSECGEEIFLDDQDNEIASMVNICQSDRYPILDVNMISELDTDSDKRLNKQDQKLGIEAVTNRLALRERSKIFRRSEKKWHVAVNETAYQMVLKDPKLLLHKKDLRLMAESEVRKTYRFAKGILSN